MTKPIDLSSELAATLCARIAAGGSIGSICADEEMPDVERVFLWLAAAEDFRAQYDHACNLRQSTLENDVDKLECFGSGSERVQIVLEEADKIEPSRLPSVSAMWLRARMPTPDGQEEPFSQFRTIEL